MEVLVTHGDVFEFRSDVLICPANPQLNMSGGGNGEILRRGSERVQNELRQYLAAQKAIQVAPGTVVLTTAGPLPFRNIIHAVAIDAFYDANQELVSKTIVAAWRLAHEHGLKQVIMPAIATGYGRFPIEEFASAFRQAMSNCSFLCLNVTLVMRDAESAAMINGGPPSLRLR
jgi:O-acetyl-ADP-ribose deacetylase (regulator of RNase III)